MFSGGKTGIYRLKTKLTTLEAQQDGEPVEPRESL